MAAAPAKDPRRAAVAPAANRVLLRLLDLAEQTWVGPAEIGRIAAEAELKLKTIEAEIYFLRELADVARALPLRLFKESDQRERLVDAVQEALDDAIRREEEMLAAEDGGG
ncbi:MAG TPA: TyeA family type III secretion system gatekeeper subunit [Geminicoccaceae bacterium]|nr:TyeA family type III secretion system gatekeeper subunit [Geminicoccaceae bacterium]